MAEQEKTTPQYIDPATGYPHVDPFQQIMDKLHELEVKLSHLGKDMVDAMVYEIRILRHDMELEKHMKEPEREE